jgi:hypothetical protein
MMDKSKTIEIDGRKFAFHKLSAKASIKVGKLVLAKILPVFDKILPMITSTSDWRSIQIDDAIDLATISHSLDMIEDRDLDKIIDSALANTYEVLRGGHVAVLNPDGTYGVQDVEDDPIIVIRLTAESLIWSLQGFFDGNRLSSLLAPLGGLLPQKQET